MPQAQHKPTLYSLIVGLHAEKRQKQHKMEFEIKDVLYIVGIVASAIISFLGTRHKLKEYVRDKNEGLVEKINDLKVQLTEQKSKDDLQQQVIDQIGKQMDNLIPQLIHALTLKKESHE